MSQLDRSKREQPYRQIADALRKQIIDGELKPNDKLPSYRQIARDWQVSPTTVGHAVDLLVSEGYVMTWQGSNSFVLDPQTTVDESSAELDTAISRNLQQIQDRLTALESRVAELEAPD